jgi:hypothetical protein
MQVDVVHHLFTIAHCQQKSSVSKTSLVQSNRIITTKKESQPNLTEKSMIGLFIINKPHYLQPFPHSISLFQHVNLWVFPSLGMIQIQEKN